MSADLSMTCEHCGRVVTRQEKPRHSPGWFSQARYCSRVCAGAAERSREHERFEEGYVPEPNSGCWIWSKSVNRRGYGRFPVYGAIGKSAHRYSYEIFCGPIPNSMCVLHSCDTPCCVNPDHLSIGTQADNLADMHRKGRAPLGERHGSARLSDADVVAIREAAGPLEEISVRFGVSPSHASMIRNGKARRSAR